MAHAAFPLQYSLIRNLTPPGPEAELTGIRTLAGQCTASMAAAIHSLFRQSRDPESVRMASMERTLRTSPSTFQHLHSGFTLLCSSAEVNDKDRVAALEGPEVVEGGDTLEALHVWLTDEHARGRKPEIHVPFTVIACQDRDLRDEMRLARTFAAACAAGLPEAWEARFYPAARLLGMEGAGMDEVTRAAQAALLLDRGSSGTGLMDKAKVLSLPLASLGVVASVAEEALDHEGLAEHAKAYFTGFGRKAAAILAEWSTSAELAEAAKPHGFEWAGGCPDGIVFPVVAGLSAFVTSRDGGFVLEQGAGNWKRGLARAAVRHLTVFEKGDADAMGRSPAACAAMEQACLALLEAGR